MFTVRVYTLQRPPRRLHPLRGFTIFSQLVGSANERTCVMEKPFFVKVNIAELLNFATDPEGEGMTVLKLAKELHRGNSDIPYIQGLIDEAHAYRETRSALGKEGAKKRWAAGSLPRAEF